MYALVAKHWPVFLQRAESQGGLPKFVVDEFDAYLRCGILEHGLVQLACAECGHEMAVAFSCKRRGFCPSCLGRRMSDIAARLVDEVLPPLPIRQWVCTLPWRLRYAMGYDPSRVLIALQDGQREPHLFTSEHDPRKLGSECIDVPIRRGGD